MKSLLMVLSFSTILISAQAKADIMGSALITFSPTTAPLWSSQISSGSVGKEARQIVQDGQEYFQTGEMSILISQKVEALQEGQEMSDDEAVDFLMNQAFEILK